MSYTTNKTKWLRRDSYGVEYRVWCGSFPRGSLPCPLRYVSFSGSNTSGYSHAASLAEAGLNGDADTTNKCYERLVSKCHDSAQAAVNLAERKQAIDMIVTRTKQIHDAFRALRKGDPFKFFKTCTAATGKLRPRKVNGKKVPRWSKPKNASNLWLEYHFGWEPMVGDIYNSMKILTKDHLYDKRVTASAQKLTKLDTGGEIGQWKVTGSIMYTTRMCARISVTNPNAFLANQVGVLNPFAVAWELVPFSFVVDWFASVGTVIGAMSDFVGLELIQPYTTKYSSGSTIHEYRSAPNGLVTDHFSSGCVTCLRTLGIDRPVLKVKEFKGFSLARGATAIALVIQVFKTSLH